MRLRVVSLTMVAVLTLLSGCGRDEHVSILYHPDFVRMVEEGDVASVEIIREPSGAAYIRGQTKSGAAPHEFRVDIAGKEDLVQQFLWQNQVAFHIQVPPQNPIVWVGLAALPLLVFAVCIGIVMFVLTLAIRHVRAIERIAKNTEK